jgi:hypothetical protein
MSGLDDYFSEMFRHRSLDDATVAEAVISETSHRRQFRTPT